MNQTAASTWCSGAQTQDHAQRNVPQGSTGAYIDDSRITTKVKAEIFKEPSLKVADINVETHKNVVQLSGFVDSAASMHKAVAIERSVEGVTSVKNDMRLK